MFPLSGSAQPGAAEFQAFFVSDEVDGIRSIHWQGKRGYLYEACE
jgi:hypothetical protein